jgi:hypothetical protein
MGAGGLQALVKTGLPIDGKRVVLREWSVVVGVAAYLRERGAEVLLIAEQASSCNWRVCSWFGRRRSQALDLKRQLSGVPYRSGCWVVAAQGTRSSKA